MALFHEGGKIGKFTETSVMSIKYHSTKQSLECSWIIWDGVYLVVFTVCRWAVLEHGQTRQLLLVPTV